MIPGEAKILRHRAAPDVKEIRRLLSQAMGTENSTRQHLADLLGCTTVSVLKWERGAKPARSFFLRLVEIERTLKAKKLSLNEEIRLGLREDSAAPEPRPSLPAPLSASAVSVTVEGEQALLRFTIKVPGDALARTVTEVIVPRTALESLLKP